MEGEVESVTERRNEDLQAYVLTVVEWALVALGVASYICLFFWWSS